MKRRDFLKKAGVSCALVPLGVVGKAFGENAVGIVSLPIHELTLTRGMSGLFQSGYEKMFFVSRFNEANKAHVLTMEMKLSTRNYAQPLASVNLSPIQARNISPNGLPPRPAYAGSFFIEGQLNQNNPNAHLGFGTSDGGLVQRFQGNMLPNCLVTIIDEDARTIRPRSIPNDLRMLQNRRYVAETLTVTTEGQMLYKGPDFN